MNMKIVLDFFETVFSKQRTRIGVMFFVQHDILSSCVYSSKALCAKIISVKFGVKLNSLNRE